MLHKDSQLGDQHYIQQWEFADWVAMQSSTGYASTDIGKVARVVANNGYYILSKISPNVWVELSSVTKAPSLVQKALERRPMGIINTPMDRLFMFSNF